MLKAAFLTCYFLSVPTATLAPAVFVPEPPKAMGAAASPDTHQIEQPGERVWQAPPALTPTASRFPG